MRPAIAFRNYSFQYAGAPRRALVEIDFEIEEGEFVILAGPSGCGKSTLLRSIIGLIPHMYAGASSGLVIVDSIDVARSTIAELAKRVGFVFQNPENQIFMFSVERDIAFGLENLGLPKNEIRERVDWALELLDITRLAHRAPHELSDGQKQRVALAGVLTMRPNILVLDEPTSLLDPRTASELVHAVKKLQQTLGITVLIVEHRLDLLANVASRVVVMNEGKVVLDGAPRDVMSNPRAALVGIGIPTMTRLFNLLTSAGIRLGSPPLLPDELATGLNVHLHD